MEGANTGLNMLFWGETTPGESSSIFLGLLRFLCTLQFSHQNSLVYIHSSCKAPHQGLLYRCESILIQPTEQKAAAAHKHIKAFKKDTSDLPCVAEQIFPP